MIKWSKEIEEELSLLLKDWLKSQGKTQKDLRKSLHANSERMSVLIETLHTEYLKGGLPKLVERLCFIEESWSKHDQSIEQEVSNSDPFSQLDLLLEELKDKSKE